MSRPTGRMLTLLELLQSGGTRTVAELADRLGVEGRTVRRYVSQLIDLGVPVESVRGRHGGYRLAPGYRLPPLMLGDDEALAVLLGLVAGRRTGLTTAQRTANETASAKIRRVLPRHLARRLDTLLETLDFTDRPGEFDTPDAGILLTLADAVHHRRPVSLRYTDRDGRHGDRTLHAYGIVAHAGRWYVTGEDPEVGEDRTLRLDRVAEARTLPGSFPEPEGPGPAQRVLSGFATAAYRHEVTVRIHGTVERIRARLPASVAVLDEDEAEGAERDHTAERWRRVELRVERLDWLPPVLASLDRPFVIERPEALRDLVAALADRLASYARGT
ncbi:MULTISPECIES: helix-turn-helix transcriptional regulator [Streptomyces]|uniref:helix-turn-helix transcriptional regulator n=1 Tax=Streptomyces TaxID=1883 RepID=UPI00163B99A5|nr:MULTISPECIES: YafY family protein [Streptomyces]MBC2878869.1 YafY family transcriptional regulator [Streptomyces sp. TYQ1024]UBI38943.1 YafY family transcriptional regulator [Streptomyces mobaraensis]UKW31522.1 YafY family transcriptional regulator [Streptomyces sp. TYQ1024]